MEFAHTAVVGVIVGTGNALTVKVEVLPVLIPVQSIYLTVMVVAPEFANFRVIKVPFPLVIVRVAVVSTDVIFAPERPYVTVYVAFGRFGDVTDTVEVVSLHTEAAVIVKPVRSTVWTAA